MTRYIKLFCGLLMTHYIDNENKTFVGLPIITTVLY